KRQYTRVSVLDEKKSTGWAVLPKTGKDHVATFEAKEPLDAPEALVFTLKYESVHPQHVFGRFRLSATTEKRIVDPAAIPENIQATRKQPAEKRDDGQKMALAAHYRTVAPRPEPIRAARA